ncbi:hypothetical protein AXG93_961s1350 [Marchantia polymorpha subsp. ruderalis]|uniref:Uncharacterized protein n=1 Tax=Marchantia polymorpha subsp. ruderalis TaxID=1480154 RepID=A0A176VU81_MARPO|nr:hypothetical protein AXG93_961s1350 [Marchantia polymorpha subsp. ruderalis]
MATIAQSLLPNHVFGVHGKMRDGVHFVDDSTIVYCAGHCVVWWKTEDKNQKVVCGTADTETMTAIALSHNRKHVAVAESCLPDRPVVVEPKKESNDLAKAIEMAKSVSLDIKGPVISIFDSQTSKKKKVLMGGDIGSRSYISLAFSHDGKCLAAQGGAPDWNLVLWSLEKSKLIASIKTSTGPEVYQVQCCPMDLNLITVIGDGFAKSFRSTDSALRPISTGIGKREGLKFFNHAWLYDPSAPVEKEKEKGDKKEESVCLYALENGEVLYTENGEIVSSISPPGGLPGAGFVEVILQFSKGFISAESGAIIGVFEKVDDESFKRTRSFKADVNGTRIVSIALSPGEELLVCVLKNRQIILVPFQNSEFYKPDEVPKEATGHGFHSEAITGLDVCQRKPLAVTSSTDKCIRVWNYLEKTCELAKYFPQEALSISLHPSGLHILVGFTDKLRLMNILIDDIRIAKEFNIKSCQDCAFSNGGQYFAAVQSNVIYIFSTYSFENLGNLRAHNGKVRSIWWSPDDTSMLTAGIDGAIYEWQLRELKRSRENVMKGCVYTSVVGLKDSKSFFAVGSDHKLKELDENSTVKTFLERPVLGAGEFYEVQAIGSPISRLVITADSSLLLCGGEDGAVVIFDIRDKEKAIASHVARHEKDASHWTSEVLVLKADLEELKARVQDLETQVTEVQAHCEYQIRIKDEGIALRIKELTDVSDKDFLESKELELEQKYKALEDLQVVRLAEMEEQYQKKMLVEVARYTALENDKEIQRLEFVEDRAIMAEKHEKALVDITDAYEDKLEVQQNAYAKLKEEAAQALLDFEEIRRQMEEDTDKEIEDQKEKYDSLIAAEKETVTRLKGENGIMKKKFNEFQKENEEQREELMLLFQQKKELYEIIGSLERDIAGLKKDVQERDDTIGEKEKRIYDMKRKNLVDNYVQPYCLQDTELEKFKFVLDFKIKDLSEQIEPREAELQDAKDQIRKMEVELERSHAMSGKKDLAISQLKLKLQGVQNEEDALRRANVLCTTTLKHFQHDYYELAQLITDPEALKSAVISVFRKYVEDKVTLFPVDEELEKDTNRQRDFLERSVAGLRRKLHKEMEAHHTNHLHIMQDNVALIKELNELRRELKIIKLNQQKGALADGSASQHRATTARKLTALAKGLEDQLTLSQQMEQENLRHRVVQLETELASKVDRITYLEAMLQELELVQNRPKSRGELPPMEGVGRFGGYSSTTASTRSASPGIKKTVQVMTPSEASSSPQGRPTSSPGSNKWSREKGAP